MKVRVKTRTPYVERHFVVEVEDRDAGWRYVVDHLHELTPEREVSHSIEEIWWASEEPP